MTIFFLLELEEESIITRHSRKELNPLRIIKSVPKSHIKQQRRCANVYQRNDFPQKKLSGEASSLLDCDFVEMLLIFFY